MKKCIFLIIFILIFYIIISFFINKNNIIPNNSIRIRVLANSNSREDQNIKKEVSKKIMIYLNEKLKNTTDINGARKIINESLDDIDLIISKSLNTIENTYKISYGYNYFPKKKFKNKTYSEGLYESILVTLGNGLGDNFWCLLFPPLCVIDDEKEDIEYSSFLEEILNF
jgi:stage II sporulation protein R